MVLVPGSLVLVELKESNSRSAGDAGAKAPRLPKAPASFLSTTVAASASVRPKLKQCERFLHDYWGGAGFDEGRASSAVGK